MEDAHTTLLAMDEKDENAFFGVYDGHAGACVTSIIIVD